MCTTSTACLPSVATWRMVELEEVVPATEQEALGNREIWHSPARGADRQPDEVILKGLIERHARYTGSERAKEILENWGIERKKFVKVFPTEYRRALKELYVAAQAKPAVAA